jgi:myosin heavy subunit
MGEHNIDMESLHADVDALRERFPKTADLYREACAVMFFRYGMTPTTTALYQLVRKGSMSVPSEALRQFWNDLRKRSRIDVENAGLPEELRESAGKWLGQIWSSARQAAEISLTHLKDALEIERNALLAAKASSDESLTVMTTMLEEAKRSVAAKEEELVVLRAELGHGRARLQEVESHLAKQRSHVETLQREALAMSKEHAADVEKVTQRVVQAEQRYVELEKRTLVELDRERMAVKTLKKTLESERNVTAARYEKLQLEAQKAQIQLARQEQMATTRNSEVAILKGERDAAAARAAESKDAATTLGAQLAAEQVRVQELREQLRSFSHRAASERKPKQRRSIPTNGPGKRGTGE